MGRPCRSRAQHTDLWGLVNQAVGTAVCPQPALSSSHNSCGVKFFLQPSGVGNKRVWFQCLLRQWLPESQVPSAGKSVPFLPLICSSVNSARGHLMTLIQGADNQVTSHFCTGPCLYVGTMMDGEVQITSMLSSPTYMWKQVWSTAHGHSSQKTDLSESHTLGQSWDCTQGSSIHPHRLCFPRHNLWGL